MDKNKVIKEKFCMGCKSKDNLQASINLLSDPAYLCSKCISDYDNWKKKNEEIMFESNDKINAIIDKFSVQ